jgi:hypothetical protein
MKKSIKNRNNKSIRRNRRSKKSTKMRGGQGGIAPFNLQDPRYVIPFNGGTGVPGSDPIAAANIVNARNSNFCGGSRRRRRGRKSRRRRLQKGGGALSYTSLDAIPDFFLGTRQDMTPVTAFGSTAGGVAYTQRELTGLGNHDGPNLAPNLGPGTKGLA